MARPTFSVRGLVLRRTKLGETDVIVTLLSQDGSQVRAVAKGARKPTSSFASRLELFCVCDLLLVSGKSLDIVKEARLVEGNEGLRESFEMVQAASPVVELLNRTTQEGLTDVHLFPMACAALSSLSKLSSEEKVSSGYAEKTFMKASLLCAAALLKSLGFLGFRPRFDVCVGCGRSLSLSNSIPFIGFSLVDGGLVCDDCLCNHEVISLSSSVASWSQALVFSTFQEISHFELDDTTLLGILRLVQMWVRQHLGIKLVSLDYLISSFA